MSKYIVQSGDTLYGIAKKFNIDLHQLMSDNQLTSTELKVGDEITIFDAIQLTTTKYIEYSVKKGDSLYSIARSYNTTVDEIKRLNSLVKEELFIGQKLRLPEYDQIDDTKLEDYIDYTVKKGDSLYSIAKTYHTTVDQILKDNNMGDMALTIGQNLIICDEKKEEIQIYEACYGLDEKDEKSTKTYTVKRGDSLYSIAKKFGISIEELKRKNHLSSYAVSVNQVLNI